MSLLPRGRRGRVLATLALVLTLAVVVLVVVTRPDVTWSVQVDGARGVRDWDADRLLVDTDDELVVLDRADGDELGRYDVPADQEIEQVALVPGGYVVQWTAQSAADDATVLARVADDGTEVWRREEVVRLRVLGVLADDGVVAVATPSGSARIGETLRGLDLDDGTTRWERDVRDHARTLEDGPTLRSVEVVLADLGRSDSGATVLGLGDGSELGTMDVEVASPTVAVYWRDVVLVADGERWSRSVAGVAAPIEGLEGTGELTSGTLLGRVGDGVALVDRDDVTWGVDLEAGTVVRLPLTSEYVERASRVRGEVDGDDLRVVDVATGDESRTGVGGDAGVVDAGPDAVLLREPLGRLAAWRHLIGDDAARLTVVDRSGERHGDLPVEDIAAATVLDDHEVAVVVEDGRRLVLLGR